MFYCRFLLLCFYLLYFCAAFRVNATSPPRNAKSSDNLQHTDSAEQNAGSTRHNGRSTEGLEGFEPGDVAPAFQVQTLDGVFIYSPQNGSRSALVVHAFTNKSAFLECLWTWSESLSELLTYLPSSTEVLLLSLDDTALQDALWMREQVYRAAAHGYRHTFSITLTSHTNTVACLLSTTNHNNISALHYLLLKNFMCVFATFAALLVLFKQADKSCSVIYTVGTESIQTPLNFSLFVILQLDCFDRKGRPVNVTFQVTPSPNFFFAINQKGALSEMGWFLYPTFRFMAWQAQWFTFNEALQEQLSQPAVIVPVFDRHLMQGETGAQAVVDLPGDFMDYDILELDASLSCPGRRDETCAHWDHTVQLYVCCDRTSPYCNLELGRWITAFRRGTGHWLTDVSPLIPLLNDKKCVFTMKTVPWAMPWMTSLNLRFSYSNQTDRLYPFKVMSLFPGGTFDKDYNSRYQEIKFSLPASTKKVELYAVITAHGSDENFCGEFCVTSHHFLINRSVNNTLVFESAGSPLGCAMRVSEGAVPNEHGTWLYGRGGWCDGLQVDPWRTDITSQLDMSGTNSVLYFGLFEGRNPDPKTNPGYIIMYSFLVIYK
uniref:Uncharacterized LOC107592527 n=1 Tax=Sinocyclocheilus grahami TaxID=75366 RepID=A0A672S712_SINGR